MEPSQTGSGGESSRPMRNKILTITRGMVPYIKELRPITGSVNACILMQQLDYWFSRYPDGFWKSIESGKDEHRMPWLKELGFTRAEFYGAFDRIGKRYETYDEYAIAEEETDDVFCEKFYCTYYDPHSKKLYHQRNHAVVDAALDTILGVEDPKNFEGSTIRNSEGQHKKFLGSKVETIRIPHAPSNKEEETRVTKRVTKTNSSSAVPDGTRKAKEPKEPIPSYDGTPPKEWVDAFVADCYPEGIPHNFKQYVRDLTTLRENYPLEVALKFYTFKKADRYFQDRLLDPRMLLKDIVAWSGLAQAKKDWERKKERGNFTVIEGGKDGRSAATGTGDGADDAGDTEAARLRAEDAATPDFSALYMPKLQRNGLAQVPR